MVQSASSRCLMTETRFPEPLEKLPTRSVSASSHLKRQIADYEQAVGRALLYHRGVYDQATSSSTEAGSPSETYSSHTQALSGSLTSNQRSRYRPKSQNRQHDIDAGNTLLLLSTSLSPSMQEGEDFFLSTARQAVVKRSSVSESKIDRTSSALSNSIYSSHQSDRQDKTMLTNVCTQQTDDAITKQRIKEDSVSRLDRTTGVNDHREWTQDLDDRLRAEILAQQKNGRKTTRWSSIAQTLKCRTAAQCQARWVEVLDEKIAKGRWSPEEDRQLLLYYARFGAHWCKIAAELTTRTQRQCRSRWLQIQAARAGVFSAKPVHS